MTSVPESEVVVLEQELVVSFGGVVQVSDIVFVILTLKQTLQEVWPRLDWFLIIFILFLRIVVKWFKVVENSFVVVEQVSKEG